MSAVDTPPAPIVRAAPTHHTQQRPVHWGTVLRLPYAARLLTATLVSRLPLGMTPVALLIAARANGHGYGVGAALASLYGLAVAVGQPLLGRLVDRRGQTRTLMAGAITSAAALLILAAAETLNLLIAAAAVTVAGATAPPMEGVLRALWPAITPTRRHLRAALALDSGSQELVYAAGPLTAVAAAAVAPPGLTFAVAAGLGLGGALAVAASAPSRRWRPAQVRSGALGALRSVGMRWMLLVLTVVGGTLGALSVAALTASERHSAQWLAGVLPAGVSIGALLGTAAWIALPLPASLSRQLALTAAVFAAVWVPLSLDPPPFAALALTVPPGMAFGALLTCAYQVVAELAPPGTLIEAYGWLIAAFGLGQSLGTAAAGVLEGPWALPAGTATLALVLSAPVCRRLAVRTAAAPSPRPSPERPS
ncbi:MFS transporter [Streptomyces sp. NBC_01571]|uniref:MFS transporter n=1 Tax=Streptomyces sp. NBC_01571 TaxID=2975883 RepID=UPI00224FEA9C|nr:MFS transporter [Streptomyces sp. NBC_01571]MCX4573389.1 MFS transporter [Streptomyces sp. NBC_01571]